ncbi:DUF5789 family protein [Halorussus halophilus]|uniref:DUF5789 family protein n=1 Tax=Halorussus halophilus TaxID=2650975 RepID=UPI001300DB7D|nr:hypothetical protein [Halorussus halophilus]
MTDSDDGRELGVELGDLEDDLESADYPMDSGELMDKYGDRELDLQGGSETLREALATGDDETFESADEVEQAILNRVSSEAVGREGYSDRGSDAADDNTDESF